MAYSSGFSNPFGFVITPWVKRLIIANVATFVVVALLAFVGLDLESYLVFAPRAIYRVWTVVTYMFVHLGVFHLLFNMLALFFFGPPLEERWGARQFLKFYLIAGMGGAALSFLFLDSSIAGASAAVYGVMVAFAMYWPESPIYIWGIFPVKAKWLVGFLVALSLFYAMGGGSSGVAHFAHLGGALAAFIYLKSSLAPSPWGDVKPRSTTPKVRSWTKMLDGITRKARPAGGGTPAPKPTSTRHRDLNRSLDDVDRILDKISEGGITSLSEEERRKLEEASRKFRTS